MSFFARSPRLSRVAASAATAFLFVAVAHCSSSSSSSSPTTSAVIGASGGRIASADGVMELIVPAGAVNSDTTMTVTSQSAPPAGAIGMAYTVQPFSVQLQVPATVLFHYGSVALGSNDPSTLEAGLYNGSWVDLPNQDDATTTKIVTGTTVQFSLFGIIGPTTGTPAPGDGGAPASGDDGGDTQVICNGTLTPSVGSSNCAINETCSDGHLYSVTCNPTSNTCKCDKDGTTTNTTSVTSCSVLEPTTLATCGFPVGTITSGTTADGGGPACTFTLFPVTDGGPDAGSSCSVSEVCQNADRYEIVCDATTGACQCSDNGVAGGSPNVSCASMTTSSITKCFYPGP